MLTEVKGKGHFFYPGYPLPFNGKVHARIRVIMAYRKMSVQLDLVFLGGGVLNWLMSKFLYHIIIVEMNA